VVAARWHGLRPLVLRPALVIGVVDVAEVYRAKEAEFTQILTKASSEEERQKALRHGPRLRPAPAARPR
jgi:hypothetical protein